jgi:hypothetical protein
MKRVLLGCVLLVTPLAARAQSAPAAEEHAGAYAGYTLIAPMSSPNATLIDMDGQVVHTWQTRYNPGASTYLLENGNLLRTAASLGGGLGGGFGGFGGAARGGRGAAVGGRGAAGTQPGRSGRPSGAAAGGRVQEIAWDGTLVWDYEFATDTQAPHHDITRLPSGNILLLIWDGKSAEQAIAAGRKPEYQRSGGELPPDGIIEVKPTGKTTGQIVWEWHAWDHLVQDFDKDKPNYGDVAAHPERIDINYSESWMDPPAAGAARGGGAGAGRSGLGGTFGGGFGGGGRIPTTDWTHLNAIAYNATLDQIIVSSYTFSEFWIIDHSTTTAQAASHGGGRSGKGGDLLYRWGNPEAYRAGKAEDQALFCPHNVHWIAPGLPGEGHILIFNNGPNRPSGERYSSVDEFELTAGKDGNYPRQAGGSFTAPKLVWRYTAPNKTDFYSQNISSAQRLPNGNTLICSGANGRLFEVTAKGKTVWLYTVTGAGAGRGAGFGGGRPGGGGFGGGGTQIFRAYRYAADSPALTGKDLSAPAATTRAQ